MGNHFVVVCEYGTRHSQCRCMAADKAVRTIECPTPRRCAERVGVPLGQPPAPAKHRKDVPTDSSPGRSL